MGAGQQTASAQADPKMPGGLHDRAADNWRPLLAIADDAGGAWPEKARTAAAQLSGAGEGDSSARVQLLVDIHAALRGCPKAGSLPTALLANLVADETRTLGRVAARQAVEAIGLGRLLKPFGVAPARSASTTRRGRATAPKTPRMRWHATSPRTPTRRAGTPGTIQ